MAVDRCICHAIPFARALEHARANACANVAQLQRHLPLGTGCGLCVPYMQCVLETGTVDLPVFDADQTESWRVRSGIRTAEAE